ncbi:MAG: ABC-2 transporter permease [bacterium]|jgi:ABC-2 type transport system permease protein
MIFLLKKDLLIQKKSFLFLFFYGIFLLITFNNPVFRDTVYSMGLIITVYFFLITANMEDEKNKSEIVLNSLPLRRSQLVLAKYLSVFVYIFIGAIILGGLGLLFQLPAIPFTPRLLNLTDLLTASFLISICVSIYLPLYFRFGATALRFFSVIFFLCFFFLPRLLYDLYFTYAETAIVRFLQNFFLEQSPLLQTAVVMIIILSLLTSSFFLSRKIYLQKDF